MDKGVIISAIFLFFGMICVSQENETSYIWDSNTKLSWKDFKGAVPPESESAATTASGIGYEYSANLINNKVKLDFEVNTFFFPNESWYKPDECNDLTLSHEQLHFDISELFARKMRKQLKERSFSDNIKVEIRKIYKKILKELSDFQDYYDQETDFSRNQEQQLLWNKKIAKALKDKD